MKKPSFQHLIKQELVNRFQDVVKNELNHFESIHKNNEKTFSELKKSIQSLGEGFSVFQELINKNSNEFVNKLNVDKNSFIDTCTSMLIKINKSFEEAQKQFQRLSNEKENLANKNDIDVVHRKIADEIATVRVILYDKERDLRYEISNCLKEIMKIRSDYDFFQNNIVSQFDKIISRYEEKIKFFELNVEGYLKDLQAVKKKAFIQEKYIEKIMTDLDQMKNEGTK